MAFASALSFSSIPEVSPTTRPGRSPAGSGASVCADRCRSLRTTPVTWYHHGADPITVGGVRARSCTPGITGNSSTASNPPTRRRVPTGIVAHSGPDATTDTATWLVQARPATETSVDSAASRNRSGWVLPVSFSTLPGPNAEGSGTAVAVSVMSMVAYAPRTAAIIAGSVCARWTSSQARPVPTTRRAAPASRPARIRGGSAVATATASTAPARATSGSRLPSRPAPQPAQSSSAPGTSRRSIGARGSSSAGRRCRLLTPSRAGRVVHSGSARCPRPLAIARQT